MYGDFYNSAMDAVLTFLFWWVAMFLFFRVTSRGLERSTWKRDLTLSLIQGVLIVALLPVLGMFIT